MKIAVLKEGYPNESRVATTPDIVKLFCKDNFKVCVESNAGLAAGFSNQDYENAGAQISKVRLEVVSDADIVLKVRPSPIEDSISELNFMQKGAAIIGIMSPAENKALLQEYVKKGISCFALELLPRITRAQNMDVLSSQSNLAGYRSVIEAAYHYKKIFPMLMTAAGTLLPAKVLVLGAGVAGLQAIATAKRLGASVSGYDVRASTKEQVESLGAKFISNIEQSFENKAGYAAELDDKYKKLQTTLLDEHVAKNDIIITTAQIPGKAAPILISKAMIEKMRPGSVIIDLAAASGGNTELTALEQIVEHGGVKIVGYSNLASCVAGDSSKLYAKNLYNFIKHVFGPGDLAIDDEIVKSVLLTHKGRLLYGL